MESNDKLKEVNTKNYTCNYFNDIIKIKDFDFDISIDEKSYNNIWIMTFHAKLRLV